MFFCGGFKCVVYYGGVGYDIIIVAVVVVILMVFM